MKTRVYLGIAFRLILLFTAAMLVTYVTPHMREFFDDTLHVHVVKCNTYSSGCINTNDIDPLWDWGIRHYWYFWMMIFLFILSLINFIVSIVNILRRNYDTKDWL